MFIDYSIAWLRGEVFELLLLSGAGGLVLVCAVVLWRFAPTPLGQAMPIPLFAVALLFIGSGIVGALDAYKKISTFREAFEIDAEAFVVAEESRVADFQYLYAYTMIGAAMCFMIGMSLFVLSEIPLLRAIAVALVFVGLSALVIDMFSKERANRYADAIDGEIVRMRPPG